jgi:hypothetical protein
LQHTISELRPFVGQILLVGPTPHPQDDVPFRMAMALWKGTTQLPENTVSNVRSQDHWFWQQARKLNNDNQLTLIDPVLWFCDTKNCRYANSNEQPLYRDTSHISLMGARLVADHFPDDLLLSGSMSKIQGR